MEPLIQVWCAMNTTLKDATFLYDTLKDVLKQLHLTNEQVVVVKLTETWYVIAGTKAVEITYKRMMEEVDKHKKEQIKA